VTKLKLLITGDYGFIGSNFVLYMLKKYSNYRIANFDKLTYVENPTNLKDLENNPNYSFMQGDICNPAISKKAVKK
jgi:dTDP-glucose 4,6-dehydratase